MALLLARTMSGYQVACSPWSVFVRVFGRHLSAPVIVASLYVPHGAARREARAKIRAALVQLRRQHPDDPIVLLGDWNCTPDRLRALLGRWGVFSSANILPHEGGMFSSTRRRSLRAIDHVVVCSFLRESVVSRCRASVLRDWDVSDHYPVVASVQVVGLGSPAPHPLADAPGPQVGSQRFLVRGVPRPPAGAPVEEWAPQYRELVNSAPVSYTHLTLPTKRIV